MEPYRSELKSIIGKIGYDYDIEVAELEIPVNHIHMVVRTDPKISPAYVIQVIKSISAQEFFRIRPEKRENIFGEVVMDTKLFC